ncbi:DUF7261 family protein [Salinirubrum litoreum]|uniref:P/Homo B domain-containing protein n=1 Tax=Salinirubrum litoreum TaxID=1126234 RepID=A0ABD5RED0_9EURY|nr:hypothetical protein [Salinirubrum litoreum]
MADVTDLLAAVGDLLDPDRWRAGDRRDRAQLVIVGGLVLAFSLIALTFILNSSLYTENVESRATLPVADDAREYHATLDAEFGTVIERSNDEDYGSQSAVETAVEDRATEIDRLVAAQFIEERGAFVDADVGSATVDEGFVVKQETVRPFTDTSGIGDWRVVRSSERVRAIQFTVDEGDLPEEGDGNPFTVDVEETGALPDRWTAELTEDSDRVLLSVEQEDGTTYTCRSTTEAARVDLSGGFLYSLDPATGEVLDVTDCGYRFAPDVDGPYRIDFTNGDEASGTWTMTVENAGGGLFGVVNCDQTFGGLAAPPGVDCGGAGGDQPYTVDAVYALETTVTYETTEIDYRTTLRVAPDEPETVA